MIYLILKIYLFLHSWFLTEDTSTYLPLQNHLLSMKNLCYKFTLLPMHWEKDNAYKIYLTIVLTDKVVTMEKFEKFIRYPERFDNL